MNLSGLSSSVALCLALCAPSTAQAPLDFTLDYAASQYTWAGSTSIGPIVGNPSNQFGLSGNFMLEVSSGSWAIADGEYKTGGVALVSPDLSGKIPNTFAWLPPLAIIDITNMTLEFTTPSFSVAMDGSYATTVITTILSGTLTVTPLVGSVTITDLTGISGSPQPFGGTISSASGGAFMTSAQVSTFSFTDPGSGLTATMTLTGILEGDSDCQTSTNYCTANVNSTGAPAHIFATGSTSIFANNLTLECDGLPKNQFGYFLFAPATGFIPNFGGSSGNLCLSGKIVRFSKDVMYSGSAQAVSFSPDMANLPSGKVWGIGQTQHFQYWTRDPGTSNTSEGLTVIFCP
ncbi:MAG TPA: hypothetical protein EYQ74_02835 [Planctomycetes bacterium]|nr:hypothetical protein [Planctomycetota bacterium]HIK62235.1 hypothetical protein [Planctomycetota bacterium]